MIVYGRATWGARYDDGFGPAPLPASELWLHHSVTSAPPVSATFEQDAAAVRALEQIGEARFGKGISYTFVIPPSGRIFAGHSVGRQGAHTGGRNTVARAICLIGNYDTVRPSEAQIAAVAALVWLGYSAGWWLRPVLDGGHRDAPGASTACPGRFAYALLPVINSRAISPAPEVPDMDNRQAGQLDTVLAQITGSSEPWTFEGWDEAYVPPAGDLTLVDLVRRSLAQNRHLNAQMDEVIAALVKVAVGNVDYEVLADALAENLLDRLASR